MEEQEQVIALAEQVLQDHELFLVDVELKGTEDKRIIWVYLESEKGNVSLDQCAQISRELHLLLEVAGWHHRKYTLNVSSPGLGRPLKDIRQYVNNLGRKASVVYKEEGKEFYAEGKLIEATPDMITLETEKRQQLEISFSDVVETRILASFH